MLGIDQFSLVCCTMNIRRVSLPTYAQSCETPQSAFCHSFLAYPLQDPALIAITLAAVIGSFCLLSGLILLCVVSQTIHDQVSEAILLMGMGFFISSVACVTWKLTNRRRLSRIIEAIKEEGA